MATLFKFILKYWYIVLIAIAVLLYVPGLFFKNLAFFGQKAPAKIANTPIEVDEIKEIGELTTAEYYGEIYADLYEAFDFELDKYEQNFEVVAETLYKMYPKIESYSKIYFEYKTIKKQYEEEQKAYEKFKTENPTNERELQRMLKDFQRTELKFTEIDTKKFRAAKERNLVYIGRGWVKAGFNFETLNSGLFNFTDKNDTFFVQLPKPQLLNADINPWFIESKKIKGYEIFMKNGNQYTNEEITLVKEHCKRKLTADAIEKGILEKATESGKATLENLFSLLKAKPVSIKFE